MIMMVILMFNCYLLPDEAVPPAKNSFSGQLEAISWNCVIISLLFALTKMILPFFALTITQKCDFEPCEGVVGTLRFKGDPAMARRSPLEVF